MRHSPLSSGYNQQPFHHRGSVTSQWGPRGPHHARFSGYDYPQRGPFPSQDSLYPAPAYGQYPPQQPPQSNYPSWDQRPPATVQGPSTQGNYGQPTPYSQIPTPTQHYGHPAYSDHSSSQQYGHMGSQPTTYAQSGTHSGYGSYDQYSKPPTYDQAPQSQPYGQSRPNQPGEVPYQGPTGPGQPYGQTVPPQQPHPYASSTTQQSYAPYGPDGYSHPASQVGQLVAGYSQPSGPTGGYGSYPSAQPSHNEQSMAGNAAYGYQGQTDPGYGTQGPAGYGAPATGQLGYTQAAPAQPGYNIPQSGGYQ